MTAEFTIPSANALAFERKLKNKYDGRVVEFYPIFINGCSCVKYRVILPNNVKLPTKKRYVSTEVYPTGTQAYLRETHFCDSPAFNVEELMD